MDIVAFLTALVEHAPKLTADAVQEYATVAHGEGGVNKVVTAARGFAQMLEDAFGIGEETTDTAAKS